jgi:hypothetical protein
MAKLARVVSRQVCIFRRVELGARIVKSTVAHGPESYHRACRRNSDFATGYSGWPIMNANKESHRRLTLRMVSFDGLSPPLGLDRNSLLSE